MAQSSRQKKATAKVSSPKLPTRAEVIDSLNVPFHMIGAEPPIKSADNKMPTAWEYFVAHHLQGYAKGRLDQAKAECIKAGVLFDHLRNPEPAKTEKVLYTSNLITVTLTVKAPGARYDIDEMIRFLAGKGIDLALLLEAKEHARYETKPAHEFRPLLVL